LDGPRQAKGPRGAESEHRGVGEARNPELELMWPWWLRKKARKGGGGALPTRGREAPSGQQQSLRMSEICEFSMDEVLRA